MYCDIGLTGVTGGRDVTVGVTWFQDGVPVTENSRVTLSGVTSDAGRLHSSLSFTPVHFSDMATYECRVTLTPILGPSTSPVTSSTVGVLLLPPLKQLHVSYSACYTHQVSHPRVLSQVRLKVMSQLLLLEASSHSLLSLSLECLHW